MGFLIRGLHLYPECFKIILLIISRMNIDRLSTNRITPRPIISQTTIDSILS